MIKPRAGDYIRHLEFRDVCIKISKIYGPFKDGSFSFKGEYWNMGFYEPWLIDKCRIKIDSFKNWYIKIDKDNDELRRAKWITILK